MEAPVIYKPSFVENPDEAFLTLKNELQWERRDDAPRSEYYANDTPVDYTYGRGMGIRTYSPQPWHSIMLDIRAKLEDELETILDVCFLNMYFNASDWLGWHADDSPTMDDTRPIVTVSLGAERDIQFKRFKTGNSEAESLTLENGSAAIMLPRMQEKWMHRIPKVGHKVDTRISLTFRGFVNQ